MQATGDLVGILVELAASMQLGKHNLKRALMLGRVHVDRNTATIILHGTTLASLLVQVQTDRNLVAETRHGLVDGVVNDLVYQLMQAGDAGRANVHAGSQTYRLKPFEYLDRPRVVRTFRLLDDRFVLLVCRDKLLVVFILFVHVLFP